MTKTKDDYQTIKIDKGTHQQLRRLAAATGETMMDLVDRLVREEREKYRKRTVEAMNGNGGFGWDIE